MKTSLLNITVFMTGAVLMILELVGSRLIAPYFGTSIYTWTSLIGVILACLSVGYWLGGKWADRNPTSVILSLILFVSALLTFLTYYFTNAILYILFIYTHNIVVGGFVAAFILFGLPSITMGMITPYCAKLSIRSLDTSGRSVGKLYMFSTIGSIIGTFLTGYYLLAVMDTYKIVLLLAIILLLTSIVIDRNKFLIIKIAVLIVFILFFFKELPFFMPIKNEKILHIINSRYQQYWVTERRNPSGYHETFLRTGPNSIQSMLESDDRKKNSIRYYSLFDLATCKTDFKKVLMIGGGGYTYPRYLLKNYPKTHLDVVELDPKMTEIASTYFGLDANDSNLSIIHEDGRVYMNKNAKKYDAIMIDAFDGVSVPYNLTTKEYIKNASLSLKNNGVLMINIISPITGDSSKFLQAEYNTYKLYFKQVEVLQVNTSLSTDKMQNEILLAYNSPFEDHHEDSRCQQMFAINQKRKVIINADKNLILTDAKAPVEQYLFSPFQ